MSEERYTILVDLNQGTGDERYHIIDHNSGTSVVCTCRTEGGAKMIIGSLNVRDKIMSEKTVYKYQVDFNPRGGSLAYTVSHPTRGVACKCYSRENAEKIASSLNTTETKDG